MNPNLSLPHRKNLRIPEFDYSQPGAYFVTIVTQNRKTFFGQVLDGQMVLNDAGLMVKGVFDQIPEHYLGVNPELFIIMPNHIHLLLHITDVVAAPHTSVVAAPHTNVVAGPRACQSDRPKNSQPQGVDPTKDHLSLPEVVHRIKSLTTNRYIIGVREKGWLQFENRLWQRNYHEHVIRNERDYQAIYDYILANPLNWEKDEEFSVS